MEILLVRPHRRQDTWLALARPARRRLRPGVRLNVVTSPAESPGAPPPYLEIVAKRDAGYVEVSAPEGPAALAEAWGDMPLPPYIRRPARIGEPAGAAPDRERYQTVYAAGDGTGAGSVAAPTAGLHFSQRTLAGLEDAGIAVARVALHVGPGTFRPPSEEQLARGRLHREYFRLPEAVTVAAAATRERGGRVIAVGTTSLRVLETAARLGLDAPGPDHRDFGATAADPEPVFCGYAAKGTDGWEVCGETRLFLRPPERVTAVDGLLTNFHLPGSSLLMLVATLTGQSGWRPVYDHAVANGCGSTATGTACSSCPDCAGLPKAARVDVSQSSQPLDTPFGFEVETTVPDGRARTGLLTTGHGTVETPVFMPVGTVGSVKAVTFEQVWATGARLILGNTYHLYLRPGHELIGRLGGLHRFQGWDGALLTDSAGFQVFFAGRPEPDHRRRRRIPLPSGRQPAFLQPRAEHGDPARPGLGHRHGLRPVRCLRGRPGGGRPRRSSARPAG